MKHNRDIVIKCKLPQKLYKFNVYNLYYRYTKIRNTILVVQVAEVYTYILFKRYF